MRKLLIAGCVLAIIGGVAAWPFVSVYTILRAIQTGDTATLQRRVDWPRVKDTLRKSIAENARSGIVVAAGEPPPSFWQRFKAASKATATPRVADHVIDSYVTPEGLPQLFSYGQVYRERVAPRIGRVEPKGPLAGTWLEGGRLDRGLAMLRRLESISVAGTSRLEFVVRNRFDPTRRYFTAFERHVLEWKLAEVRVLPQLVAAPAAGSDPF